MYDEVLRVAKASPSLIDGLVTEHVTEQMKFIRGACETTWPPIAGMSEQDGCSSIQDLLLAGAKETITAALGQEFSAEHVVWQLS